MTTGRVSEMRLREMFWVLTGKVGAATEPDDVAFRKLVDRLDFGPPREFPIKCPDGVVYWSEGSVEYPKGHAFGKACEILNELSAESEELRKRIEAATGQYYVNTGPKGA